MICSSVSVILPLACAREAMYCARSPDSRAASRSSVGQARDLHQMLVIELADADQLLFDQRDFLVLCLFLRREAPDFLVQLRHPLAQLRLLSGSAVDANLEQFGFAGHDVPDVGIVGAIGQHRRKLDLVETALLGLQPCGARPQSVQRLDDDRKARLDHGLVEPHHDIAGLDDIAVAHAHFADHAAGRMLHLLDVGIDHHRARRDQRARNRHRRSPAAKPAGQHQHQHQADDQMRRVSSGARLSCSAVMLCRSRLGDDLDRRRGGATRCSTWPSTVSFGPNACMRPSFSTSS